MRPLLLQGYGVKIRVDSLKEDSTLEIQDGKLNGQQKEPMRFRPRRFPYSSVIVESKGGYISFRALHWLAANNAPIFLTRFDGTIISSLLPPTSIRADLRAAQFRAVANSQQKFLIAKALVTAKLDHSLRFLQWLNEQVEITKETGQVETQLGVLERARTLSQVRMIEACAATAYWRAYGKALPKQLDFHGRKNLLPPNLNATNASDPINAALNYGYGFLATECIKAINEAGLEPSVAFLHEFHMTEIRPTFAFDLQEPYRWLIDHLVLQLFQAKTLGFRDFYFTGDDYRYRFTPEAKQCFVNHLRRQFNKHPCTEGTLDWAEVIKSKTAAFGRYLMGRGNTPERLDFTQPIPILRRTERFSS